MRQQMVSLATTRRTLMVGLSAQDINIRDVFRDGKQAMPWAWPSHPPAYVFAEEKLGEEQRVILNSVYQAAYDADPNGVADASRIRAFAKPLLVALVLEILHRKLAALARRAFAPNLAPSERDALEAGLKTLRDRTAGLADGERTIFVRSLVAESGRVLRMFRPAAAGGTYEPLGIQTVNQIPADPNNGVSGLPELASALALLGLGEANGDWIVERANPLAATNGSLRVVPSSGIAQRVFFVANQDAALQLHVNGVVDEDEPDAISSIRPRQNRAARARPGLVAEPALT
jgi:hypothetical protein